MEFYSGQPENPAASVRDYCTGVLITKELEMAECGCGRSPNGNCVGWHDLTEEKYLEKKAAYEAKQAAK